VKPTPIEATINVVTISNVKAKTLTPRSAFAITCLLKLGSTAGVFKLCFLAIRKHIKIGAAGFAPHRSNRTPQATRAITTQDAREHAIYSPLHEIDRAPRMSSARTIIAKTEKETNAVALE
jgi:hypothetical protein